MSLRKTLRGITRLAAVAVLVASPALVTLTLQGCGTGPSHVSQGVRFNSEDPTYDRYFDTLYALQVELGQAPEQGTQVRRKLAAAAGTTDTQTQPVILAVEKHTARMKAAGLTLALKVSEPGAEPDAKIEFTSGLAEDPDKQLAAAIEEAARAAQDLGNRMEKAKAGINELEINAGPLLAAVDETFRKAGPVRKAEVRSNLEDAQRLFPLMRQRANETAADAHALSEGLVKVANTTPPPAPAPPPEPEPAPKKKGSHGGAPKGPGAAPAPAAAPAPKPAKPPPTSSDGFEP